MDETQRLVIDHAAGAARPTSEGISEWAAEQRAFISSVIDGYREYRQAAADGVSDVGAEPVWFERFGGRDGDPTAAYLSEVRSCDIYLGLLGDRYGRPLPSRYSATHEEYREAERSGLRLSVWAQGGIDREGPQQSFLEEIRQFNVTGGYTTPEDLRRGIATRLSAIAAEDLSPWCKLGNVIFRAREINERAGEVEIRAAVKARAVADALYLTRDFVAPRRQSLSFPDRSLSAEVTEVETTTRARGSREFRIVARAERFSAPTRFSFNGVSWDELTDMAVRVSILGEPDPFGLGSPARMTNPLSALVTAGVSEESLRPLAHLVLSEVLAEERGVARIISLRLGASIAGRRALKIEYLPSAEYSNVIPAPRTVAGTLAL